MKRGSGRARLREIVAAFARHGFKEGLNPRGLRLAMEELGPTFVKIGQVLSTRADILPESYALEFQKLQDEVCPEPFQAVKPVLEEGLNRGLAEVFLAFEEEPMACASLAQVHRAVLRDGREVVVKIKRPLAGERLLADLKLLRRLARFLRIALPIAALDFASMVDELREAALVELDFRLEAENLARFAALHRGARHVTCPRSFPAYTTKDILVMERLEGIKPDAVETLARAGHDPGEIGIRLAENYFKQVFIDGFFHADPHPGNIVIHQGRIAYLDFGMMGVLDRPMRHGLKRLLAGAAAGDAPAMARAVLRLGTRRGPVNQEKLESGVAEIHRRYLGSALADLELAGMVGAVLRLCRENHISLPRQIALLAKGLLTMESLVAKLAPEASLAEILASRAGWIVLGQESSAALSGRPGILRALPRMGLEIPIRFLELLRRALSGNLTVRMEHANLERNIAELSKMANRIVFALIIAALIVGSSSVINAEVGPKLYGVSAFGLLGFLGAAVMGLWLLVSILRSGRI
ncbi:MAG: ABC1 kinase family protein [Patescibacteria group bacterium]